MNPPTNQMKLTKRVTSIDDLPPEMFRELFKRLNLKDLAVCPMVNRRWHSIYSAYKLYRLVAAFPDYENDLAKWYDTNQAISGEEAISPVMFNRLTKRPLLMSLKHLVLGGSLQFNLNKLNHLQQLVHLEIDEILYHKEVYLNLPRLEVLAIHGWNACCPLSIDCLRLSTLRYAGEDKRANLLDVKHPETIRKLETDIFGPQLAPFKGIECLVTQKFQTISRATLLTLPKLRELRYNRHIEFAFQEESHNGPGTAQRIERKLGEFLEEAKKLRGSDFRFIFSGFQLTKTTETILEQIDFGVEIERGRSENTERVCNEYVYMKNYRLIEPGDLDFIQHVDYNDLLHQVTKEFPRCFSQKFTGIYWVETSAEIHNADQFLCFLKSLKFLRRLELETIGLSQEFYDQLPASCPSLSRLCLKSGYSELQLNFDFIHKLSNLSELDIRQTISLKSSRFLVRSLGRFKEVRFTVRHRKNHFQVSKEKSITEYFLYSSRLPSELLLETENPDEIVKFFERLWNDTN